MKNISTVFTSADATLSIACPSKLFAKLQVAGCGMALWRSPQSSTAFWLGDKSGGRQVMSGLEDMKTGFLVSPFESNSHKGSILLEPDILAKCILTDNPSPLFYWEKGSTLAETLARQEGSDIEKNRLSNVCNPTNTKKIADSTQIAFEGIVRKAIDTIREGKFQKVVVSRRKFDEYKQQPDIFKLFERLCKAYPNAFVAIVYTPEYGLWVGASPEILISTDANGIFHTVALAGTQPKALYPDITQATWKQKEIEEQALVSRYIINCFKKIRLREYEEIGPRTIEAGHLIHLRTDFLVDTIAVNFPQLGSVMLELLHPTSAVCGMPKQEALDFIRQHELHNRSLYSGYWGVVNWESETKLFVNLRCAELLSEGAYLYAGAGITHDSVPEKEWLETEFKMKVIGERLK